MSVCLSAGVSQKHTSKLHEIFFTCYPGPWFGLHFTTVEHVTCFRFCAPHHVSHNRPERRDAASSHKFPTYLLVAANCALGALVMTTWATAIGCWPAVQCSVLYDKSQGHSLLFTIALYHMMS